MALTLMSLKGSSCLLFTGFAEPGWVGGEGISLKGNSSQVKKCNKLEDASVKWGQDSNQEKKERGSYDM